MLSQTSLLAYKQLNPTTLGKRQQQVYEAIEELQPCSDKQVAKYTGIAYHTVAARRSELGHLVELYGVEKQDGRLVRVYKVYTPDFPAMRELRAARREAE